MKPSFVHLHLHSEYSLVDGLVRVKPLLQRTAELGMPAVALTDLGNLFAMIKFYRAAISAGIKPIVGVDLWLRRAELDAPFRVVFLCQNLVGYRNLARIVSQAYLASPDRDRAVLDVDTLNGLTEGIIAIGGGWRSDIGRQLCQQKTALAEQYLAQWQAWFPTRFYLSVTRTGRREEAGYLDTAVGLAVKEGVPIVATNEVCFLSADEYEAHEARVCIHQGRQLDDASRPRGYSDQQYLRSPAEMAELFADLPEALANSVEIARRCNLELQLGHSVLPDFPTPEGMSAEAFFEQQAIEGLESRLAVLFPGKVANEREPYDQRLRAELDVIVQMGCPGYFLIVADFIRWARENDVPVGPGRGSGAGSLVAYALGITDLDPITYELLFERFLNPERVSMPDFDIDFCMAGRDRVIDYVTERYGRDRVAQIATHGTMAAKAVVRDVGRVMGHPYGFVDRIAKLIPFKPGVLVTLDQALAEEQDLKDLYQNDDEIRSLIDLAKQLEGLARNVGKHAGGVVIAPSALTDFSPLYCEPGSQSVVTQFDKDDVEAVGLVKFDFLGLRTLTIIDWALKTVNERRRAAGESALDINAIALDDGKTFERLKGCETTAVFQLESRGMKDLIKRLQPDRFEDIVALVALFRPGPLQSGMVDDFINRKHGRAAVEYPHPDLEPILEPTYGVILYQEQVMQIAQVLANYTLGGADLLRRAMGKKKPEEMAKQRSIFLAGAKEREIDPDLSGFIFDLMEKFAGYGFNRSHSAAYALVSYQTAWLKAHYPAAFMAAVLSSDMDNSDKVVVFIDEIRRLKIEIVPPSINRSYFRFTVDEHGRIVYGLGAIKGLGEGAIEALIAERESGGAFRDLFDLCRRADQSRVNRRVFESLIRAGACDDFGDHRAASLTLLADALAAAEQAGRSAAAGQTDLFGLGDEDLAAIAAPSQAKVTAWDEQQRLAEEKKTLGLYLTGHPIERFVPELQHMISGPLSDFNASADQGRGNERPVTIAGLIVDVRTRVSSRGGSRMAFVTLDDQSARIEVRVFSEAFDKYKALLVNDNVILVRGKLSFDDFSESMRVSADDILDMDAARDVYAQGLVLKINADQLGNGMIDHLSEALAAYRDGRCRVLVDYSCPGARARLEFANHWRIQPKEPLLRQLKGLIGDDNVSLYYQRGRVPSSTPV